MHRLRLSIDYIEYVILALLAVGFGNIGNNLLLFLFIIIFLFEKEKKIIFSGDLILLFSCFFSFYYLYTQYYELRVELYTLIMFLVGPTVGFLIGQILVKKDERKLSVLIIIVNLCLLIHGVMNLLSAPEAEIWYAQNIPDIWTGNKVSATLNGAYFTGAIVLFCYLIDKKRLFYKLLSTVLLCLMIWSSVKTAERTLMINLVISVLAFVYGKIYFEKKDVVFKQVFKYTLALFIFACVIILAYSIDLLGIQTAFLNTSLGSRLTMLDSVIQDNRLDALLTVLAALWEQPMGNLKNMFYAHNLFVDMGRMCGIVPMILLIFYIIKIMVEVFSICKNDKLSIENRMLFYIFHISFLINFMVEPVLEGMPMVFTLFCIVNGGISALRYRLNK